MRILQLVTAFQYRGAEIAALQFSREFLTHGHEVFYISLYGSQDDFVVDQGIEAVCLNGTKRIFIDVSLIFALSRAIGEIKPDIVQANAGDTLKYAAIVSLFHPTKFKLVFRNASTVSRYLRSSTQKVFNGFLYSRVDKVLSVSQESMRDLLSIFPRLRDRTTVIPNGIAVSTVLRTAANLSEVSIIHVGGFTFEKNHQGLIRIFQKVLRRMPNARLKLIGQGPLMAEVQKDVKDAGIGDKVEFAGTTRDALKFIAAADVLVLPSIIEGLPAVILEGFLCMTPVVAYDVGGISEVVLPEETGWLIKAGDEVGFSDAIVEAISTTDRGRQINAQRLVMEKYDIERLAVKIIEEYWTLYNN